MTELLQAPERKGLIISDENIPFSAYQAIYHKITKKTETISRDFSKPYQINFDDIKNLDLRLRQLIAQYRVKGVRCEISHSTKDGFSRNHSSFEKFQLSDMSARDCTSSFSYELDFLIVIPAQIPEAEDIPQRYKIEVVFEQTFFDSMDDKLPYFLKDFVGMGSLSAKIEYADYAVAQSVDATVKGWIDRLPVGKKSALQKAISSSEGVVMKISAPLTAFTALVGGLVYMLRSEITYSIGSSIILLCFALATISAPIVQSMTSRFFSCFKKTYPCPSIILTEGDKERVRKNDDIAKRAVSFMGVFIVGVLIAFAVNISSAWVFERFF